MTRQRIKEEEVGWKRGTVQRGNAKRSKQRSRVDPLLTCLRAGGCQRAWEQTRMRATCGEDCATRADLSRRTNTPQNTTQWGWNKRMSFSFLSLRFTSSHSSARSPAVPGTTFRAFQRGSWQKASSLCGLHLRLSPAEDLVCLKANCGNF